MSESGVIVTAEELNRMLRAHRELVGLVAHLDWGAGNAVRNETGDEGSEPDFHRTVYFAPAFDRRSDNPEQDYGIGAMTMKFVLRGPAGAIQWMISTGWYPTHCWKKLLQGEWEWHQEHPEYGSLSLAPSAWDIGYHSPLPMHEDQGLQSRDCPYTGGLCFYDGSALNAEPLLEPFLTEGPSAVWRELRERYRSHFEDVDERTGAIWESARNRDWSQVEAADEVPREERRRRMIEATQKLQEAVASMRESSALDPGDQVADGEPEDRAWRPES